jgi:hypothetical protein
LFDESFDVNSDNSVVDYAREVIRDWLERFEQHARLPIDSTTPVEVDVSQLAAAAQRSLAALALCEGCCLHDSRRRVRNYLREAAKIASGMIEVRFITGLLQAKAVLLLAGCELVRERADLRLSRYSRRLAKLRRRMVIERFDEQTQQLVKEMTWDADGSEPRLGEFAKASAFDAQRQVCGAADLDESNLTIVHELSSRLQHLSHILKMFEQVLRHDQWDSVTQDVNELQLRIAPVVDYSMAEMHCTGWLEKSRDADEIKALGSLIALAAEQSEYYYAQLASWWDAQRASDLRIKFEHVLNEPSDPL